MEAAQALADLTEISSQIEAAVLADAEGSVVASTLTDDARATGVARAAVELLAAAEEERGEGARALVQVQAAFPDGSVFVVRGEGGHLVAAATRADPTVGLVFYDLKTCLRLVAEEPAKKPAARRRRKKEDEERVDGEA